MADDTLTRKGAHKLASQIVGYWFDRGEVVRTNAEYIEPSKATGRLMWACYGIRSDMIDGYPRALWETRNA